MATQGNVIVGFALGAGTLKIGDYDSAEGACTDIGYTEGGAEITIERDYYQKKVDQEVGVLDALKVSEKAMLKVSFAEATLENIARAMDYDDAVAVAGSGELFTEDRWGIGEEVDVGSAGHAAGDHRDGSH